MALQYEVNEKVLCHHQGQIYEAKILSIAFQDSILKYKVHYNGFKKKWDEFVEGSRLMKVTEENVAFMMGMRAAAEEERLEKERAKEREKALRLEAQGKGRPITPKVGKESARDSPVPGGRKDSNDGGKKPAKRAKLEPTPKQAQGRAIKNGEETKAEAPKIRPPEIQLHMPDNLKKQLVDDNDFIVAQQKLVPLPRTPSVSKILMDYVRECKEAQDENGGPSDVDAVVSGLRDYFNAGLGTLLLYRLERVQYREVLESEKNVQVADVYGAEHLLRLFVKLPACIADAEMSESAVEPIARHVTKLLKYMSDHADKLFLRAYETTTLQYIRQANPS